MKLTVMIAVGFVVLVPVCWGAEQLQLKDEKARESYSLGYEFGNNLRKQNADVDVDILLKAIRESLEGKKSVLGPGEIRETLQQLRSKLLARQERKTREMAAANAEEGKKFLEANKTKEGVKTLPSGLQYRVLREGDGPRPKPTDMVTVNYRGTLVDGTEFDSSYLRGKPQTVHVQGVIPGWTEALQLMKVGSEWQLFVPPDLGYGKRSLGRIPPNATLIFTIELLSLADRPDVEPREQEGEGEIQ